MLSDGGGWPLVADRARTDHTHICAAQQGNVSAILLTMKILFSLVMTALVYYFYTVISPTRWFALIPHLHVED